MTDTAKILPKLRFPEFENDGEWKVMKFKDIFTMLSNNTLSRAELSEQDGIALNIHYGDVLIKFGERLDLNNDNLPHIKDDEILHKYKSSYLKDGDVIFADTAEDETAGKCTEIRNIGKQIVISGLHTIPCRPKNEFAPYYLGYYLNSNAYHTKLLPLMQGAKVTSISRSSLQETTVVYPPSLPEQQKIAAFLTSLDEQISAHTKKLEALKAHKKGLMQQLFPANGEKTPKLRFPEFKNAGEWKEVRLGEILDYEQPTPFLVASETYKDNGIPVLTAGKTFILGYTKETFGIYQNYPVIIFDDFTTDSKYVTFPFKAKSSAMKILSLNKRHHNNLYFMFVVMQLNLTITNDHKRHWISEASRKNVIVPSLPEQQKIASFLTSIDDMIQAQNDKIRKLKTYKNGLMQQMFAVETPYYDVSTDGNKPMTPYYDVSTDDGKLTMTPYYDVSTDDGKPTKTPYYDVSTDGGKLTMTPYYDVPTDGNKPMTPYYDVSTDGNKPMTPYYDVSTDDGKLTETPYYDVSTGNN